MGGKQTFRCRFVNIGLNYSKRVKVVFWPQKYSAGDHFMLSIADYKGGPGNPSVPIGFNGKSATNFRS